MKVLLCAYQGPRIIIVLLLSRVASDISFINFSDVRNNFSRSGGCHFYVYFNYHKMHLLFFVTYLRNCFYITVVLFISC